MNVDLNLDAMVAFEAVARHGSFTRAARELCVTQSAVSHRVRSLEAQLGTTLLIRTTRSVRLTDDGETLAAGVRRGLEAIEDALSAMHARRGPETLAVSCSPSFAIRWLVRHLPDFRRLEPSLAIRLAAEDRLVEPGREGIDVCIRFGAGHYPGFVVERLTHETVTVVASPAYLEAHPLRRLSELSRHALLHHEVLRDHPGRVHWPRYAEGVRGVEAEIGARFSHAHMALEAALAGQGVALGRSTLVADDLEAGRLRAPLRRRIDSGLAYWFVTTHAGARDEGIQRFRAWLHAALPAPRANHPSSAG